MNKSSSERFALLSVTDKTGIVELAYALTSLGYKLIAAGGTAAALRRAELGILSPQEIVAGPDVLEGMGLLHPKILIGVTADRDNPGKMHELERRRAVPVDIVAVNLYPVAQLIADGQLSQAEVLECVDLEGSALLRAAARNFRHVLPICDPDDYQSVIEALRQYNRVLPERRQALAAKAFHYSAYYDTTVAQYLGGKWDRLPDELAIGLKRSAELRYGENPQQQGALYTLSGARPWGINAATLLHGKELSYNHFLDLEVAWELATEIQDPAFIVVKHAVPAGAASADRIALAARSALRSDPRGALRAMAAVNREVDEETALLLAAEHLQCVAAPQFSQKALDILKTNKDLRLVTLPSMLISAHEMDFRAVSGGVLVQEKDNQPFLGEPRAVSRRPPGELEVKALRLAWHAARHSRTHAAVICRGSSTIGIGSGQTSRLDAVRLALVKSQERHPIVSAGLPLVMASDGALAAEHILEAASGGISAIIHPGGSSEDRDAAAVADEKNIAVLHTGIRHFRH